MRTFTCVLALAAIFSSAPVLAQSALRDELLSGQCVLSIANGRNLSQDDPKFNEFWNRINASLQQFLDERLRQEKIVVVSEFFPVEARDADARMRDASRVAIRNGCTSLLQLAAFAERANELVVRVTLNRLIFRKQDSPPGTHVSIGAEAYARAYRYDTSGNFGETFVFSDVAGKYAEELLAARAKP